MSYSQDFFEETRLSCYENNNTPYCITFSLEGQSFGLLLPEDSKIVLQQDDNIEGENLFDSNIDLRKILGMPITKRPTEKLFVSRNDKVYQIEVDVKGLDIPFSEITKEPNKDQFSCLWNHVADDISYINEQLVVLLNFEKVLTMEGSINNIESHITF
ncbi:MAG: hypothetical protein AB7U85_03845 [Alphaproteobacteria bacterium]